MTNSRIADILRQTAFFYEMEEVQFKPRAYERAADAIQHFPEEMAALHDRGGVAAFKTVPGVGAGIAAHIEHLLRRGIFPEFQRLARKYPVDIASLSGIEGIGPKTVKRLYRELKIRNLADLEKAAAAGRLAKLPGFGKKTEENIRAGIDRLKRSAGRRLLGEVLPLAGKMESALLASKAVRKAATAGSIRRRQETVGDIDILAIAGDAGKAMDAFARLPEVAEVVERGKTKVMARLRNGMSADLRVVPEESFGAALQYFTGSKDHNILLRERAIRRGLKLNEYGLWRGSKALPCRTEEEIYRALGLDYIEPELRTAAGEIDAAEKGRLPALIPYGSVRGDLQAQTDWTDGESSIGEMAEAAMAAGLEYLAVTDHTRALAMVGGLDPVKLARQGAAIDKLNAKLAAAGRRFRVLKGTECDILKDGSLDLPDEALKKLDIVGVAVHSYFKLPRAEQTARIIRAMENPHVDILFHPSGRVIGRRDPIELDWDKVIRAARETRTILEIDAFPDRLDLNDAHVRRAVEAGVKLAIDTDAHRKEHLGYLDLGVAQARRGWAMKKDVINTQSVASLMKWLSLPKNRRR